MTGREWRAVAGLVLVSVVLIVIAMAFLPDGGTTVTITWPDTPTTTPHVATTCAEVDMTGSWWVPGEAFGGVICDAKVKPNNLAAAKRAGA